MQRPTTAEGRIPERFSKIRRQGDLAPWILPCVVFGALWSMLIAGLSPHWATNPQYSFGWFVPVICAYLFLMRWRTRPSAEVAKAAKGRWVFWIAAFALPPTWLVEQANPDWRLLNWLLASEIVALSLCTSTSWVAGPGSGTLRSVFASSWCRSRGWLPLRISSFKA